MEIRIRDLRNKDQYKVDDAYLNGYARVCGVYATAVYNSLSRHADFHTQECFPSIEKIAYQHKISKKTAIKGIKELEKWNIIKITKEKDPKTKRQLNNIYLLIDKTQWIPKPKEESRVSIRDSGIAKAEFPIDQSRVSIGDKSRVYVGHCKDNTEEKDTNIRVVAKATDGVFSFKEELKKMIESKRKDLKIIAFYWVKKRFTFENREQFEQNLKRELRPAKVLIGYSKNQIEQSIDYCQKEYKVWTLESVGKRIADLINKQ